MAEWMADVFIELVNRSIAASWLVLAVLILRLLLLTLYKENVYSSIL